MASVDAEAGSADDPDDRRPRSVVRSPASSASPPSPSSSTSSPSGGRSTRSSDPTRTIDLFWTLRLRLLYNRGTAFSLTDNSGPVVSVIAVVVVVVLLRSGRQQRSRAVVASYGLVVGGTIGNLVDRIFRAGDGLLGGGVVDFVDPQWFPVFNVADAALTIGIGLLLVAGLLHRRVRPTADETRPS